MLAVARLMRGALGPPSGSARIEQENCEVVDGMSGTIGLGVAAGQARQIPGTSSSALGPLILMMAAMQVGVRLTSVKCRSGETALALRERRLIDQEQDGEMRRMLFTSKSRACISPPRVPFS